MRRWSYRQWWHHRDVLCIEILYRLWNQSQYEKCKFQSIETVPWIGSSATNQLGGRQSAHIVWRWRWQNESVGGVWHVHQSTGSAHWLCVRRRVPRTASKDRQTLSTIWGARHRGAYIEIGTKTHIRTKELNFSNKKTAQHPNLISWWKRSCSATGWTRVRDARPCLIFW